MQLVSREDVELRAVIVCAQLSMDRAKKTVMEAIADRVRAGALLLDRREQIGHGHWQDWLEETLDVDGFSYESATRWMRLARFAKTHAHRLESAHSVRQAYQLAGILPEPEGGGTTGSTSAGNAYLTYLVRSVTHISARVSQRPIGDWPEDERRLLVQRLEPLVDFYRELTGENATA